MEVKVVISFDECAASILQNLISALEGRKAQEIKPTIGSNVKEEETTGVNVKPVLEPDNEPEDAKSEPDSGAKTATLGDIRGIARKLADDGRQDEYKVILKKYGYAKVNNIEEENYQAIYDEMSALAEGE